MFHNNGLRQSPWMVPRRMGMSAVSPCGVAKRVTAPRNQEATQAVEHFAAKATAAHQTAATAAHHTAATADHQGVPVVLVVQVATHLDTAQESKTAVEVEAIQVVAHMEVHQVEVLVVVSSMQELQAEVELSQQEQIQGVMKPEVRLEQTMEPMLEIPTMLE